ncbi:3'(2'),5'-bisphosphate nucleotidase CysQ, partial [Mesorhizobium sp. M1A.F.Ca.IN.022.07.1.1]
MPKSSMTMAAASDDAAMLGVFERLALDAGRAVMRVFHEGCAVDSKSDSSPVTEADRESEKIILAGLRAAYPDIPCVAEEEVAAGISTPHPHPAFFLR